MICVNTEINQTMRPCLRKLEIQWKKTERSVKTHRVELVTYDSVVHSMSDFVTHVWEYLCVWYVCVCACACMYVHIHTVPFI